MGDIPSYGIHCQFMNVETQTIERTAARMKGKPHRVQFTCSKSWHT